MILNQLAWFPVPLPAIVVFSIALISLFLFSQTGPIDKFIIDKAK
jgi:hypothetical protein